MPVITYVICSSKVRKLKDSMREGINTYKVRVIRLKNESADKVLENLSESPKRKIKRKDMIPLLFTPLMSGEKNAVAGYRKHPDFKKSGKDVFGAGNPKNGGYFIYSCS